MIDQIQIVNLFYPTIQWQQINLWLQNLAHTMDTFIHDYAFIIKETKAIIDNNEILSSTVDHTDSITIDAINQNLLTKVIFTFQTHNQTINAFKSSTISSLLCNENIRQQLNLLDISMDDYKYLTTVDSKRILNPNEKLCSLDKTKFIVIKENETCLVSIKNINYLPLIQSNNKEDTINQRFPIFATISDVYKENQIDDLKYFLLYSNDFIPSSDIELISFQYESPIQFTLIDHNLPATISTKNSNTNRSIQFNCKLSISVKRLLEIACQLFNVKKDDYSLATNDGVLIDDNMPLHDIEISTTEFKFQLILSHS